MLNQTRRALEDFDNQHEFERLAADMLNALGYSGVEPIAPCGGADGGRDISFRAGDTPGIAFVTLNKKIRDKFKNDLGKLGKGEGAIALFCHVDVSHAMKLDLAKEASENGYTLEVFDLERLRSLLDSSLKDLRRRFLNIDDDVVASLRSEVAKLLRFPAATPDISAPPTHVERLLANKLPRRLFDLLMRYEESDVLEVPGTGTALHAHLTTYYQFRQMALHLEESLTLTIGKMVKVRFRHAWEIYLRYVIMRFGGISQETIIGWGDFLNYEITWDDAESVYTQLANNAAVSSPVSEVFRMHERLGNGLNGLISNG